MKRIPISFKLPAELVRRLRSAADHASDPYAPTLTAVVERGIELALRELGKKPKTTR